MTNTNFLRVIILLIVSITGCAGSRQGIEFDTVTVPLSLTKYVLDQNGKTVGPEVLKPVGRLQIQKKRWSIFWSFIPVNSLDLSGEVQRQITAVNGDAVINLQIMSPGTCYGINGAPVIDIFPLFPGCIDIKVSGDIVKVGSP